MTAGAVIARLRAQSGQSVVEFAGTILLVVLAGLFALQLAVAGWAAVAAGNAARTAARLESRGDSQTDAQQKGMQELDSKGLDTPNVTKINFGTGPSQGDQAVVTVPIPRVLPIPKLVITQSAEIPPTG